MRFSLEQGALCPVNVLPKLGKITSTVLIAQMPCHDVSEYSGGVPANKNHLSMGR